MCNYVVCINSFFTFSVCDVFTVSVHLLVYMYVDNVFRCNRDCCVKKLLEFIQ